MVSRTERQFEEYLMQEKQKKFKEFVLLASASLGLPKPPKVEFWDVNCPYGRSGEMAHIHPDIGVICISKWRLKQMTMEDIEETATHEVTHMVEHAHDDNFYIKHSDVKLGSWLIRKHGIKKGREARKRKPKKSKSKKCDYHLCEKEPSKLYRCKLCGNYFCKKHSSPKVVSMLHNYLRKEPELAIFFDKERERKNAHPCFPFTRKKIEEIKAKERESYEKLFESLDKMRGKKIRFPVFSPKPPQIHEKTKIPFKTIGIVILLIIAVYIIFIYNGGILGLFLKSECKPNFVKTYESGASFGREPFTYCMNTCKEEYSVTSYKLVEPNETNPLTICYCDVNECNP